VRSTALETTKVFTKYTKARQHQGHHKGKTYTATKTRRAAAAAVGGHGGKGGRPKQQNFATLQTIILKHLRS
jgi:hypothetical protein